MNAIPPPPLGLLNIEWIEYRTIPPPPFYVSFKFLAYLGIRLVSRAVCCSRLTQKLLWWFDWQNNNWHSVELPFLLVSPTPIFPKPLDPQGVNLLHCLGEQQGFDLLVPPRICNDPSLLDQLPIWHCCWHTPPRPRKDSSWRRCLLSSFQSQFGWSYPLRLLIILLKCSYASYFMSSLVIASHYQLSRA